MQIFPSSVIALRAAAGAADPYDVYLPILLASLCALAVGVSFAFLAVDIRLAVALIGATTFLISLAGVLVGTKAGGKFRGKAELAGGVLLFLIGLKILLEHLGVISF